MDCDGCVMNRDGSGQLEGRGAGCQAIRHTPRGLSSASHGLERPESQYPHPSFGKRCPRCEAIKPLESFYRCCTGALGRASWCKKCMDVAREENRKKNLAHTRAKQKERHERWVAKNAERNRTNRRKALKRWKAENKDKISAYEAEYRGKHKEKLREWGKRWREENKARALEGQRKWRQENRRRCNDTRNEYRKRRLVVDPAYRLLCLTRGRIKSALKGLRKPAPTTQLLGAPLPDVLRHIERQFRRGMTWDNWGKVWHVDHIRPLAGFELSDPDQLAQACHFTNLRPLAVKENLSKGAKQVFLI